MPSSHKFYKRTHYFPLGISHEFYLKDWDAILSFIALHFRFSAWEMWEWVDYYEWLSLCVCM